MKSEKTRRHEDAPQLAVDWLGVGIGTCTLLLASPARRSHRDRPRNSGPSSRYGRRAESIPSHILAIHSRIQSTPCHILASLPISWPRIVSRPVSGVFPGCPLFTGRLTMRWSCHRPRSLPISWPSRTFSRAQRAGACDDAEKDSPASARGRHGGAFAGPTTRLRARADHHYAWRRLRPAHREDAACD